MDRVGDPVGTTNNTQYTMAMDKLALGLNSTKHTYNAEFKTFHITMEHLYGENSPIKDLQRMGDLPIEITNPDTGVTVRFDLLVRNAYCGLYKALYARNRWSPAIQYKLIVWENATTMKLQYKGDTDMHSIMLLAALAYNYTINA